MTVRLTIAGASTYRFSDISHESGGALFLGRLQNAPALEEIGKLPDGAGQVRSITAVIRNEDQAIPTTENLWGAVVTLEIETASGTRSWAGAVKRFEQDASGRLTVNAADDLAAELARMIPDETIRLSTYSDAGSDSANLVVPTVFGGLASDPITVRGILVDRVNFRYLLCVGEIRQVVSLFRDREEVLSGYTSATGTAGQAVYPGFAFVQCDEDPRDETGRWPEITATVVGLKLGAHSAEESRNPARILQYLMTTASTGACGWGLGISAGKLDSTAFAQAISDCDTAGFKIDGAFRHQMAARQWIEQVLLACRGRLTMTAGKYAIYIDKAKTSVKTFTAANMRLLNLGRGSSAERVNRVALEYRYDAYSGRMLGTQQRDDGASQAVIGIQDRMMISHLVRDHTTAGAIADYLLAFEAYGEQRIRFETADDCRTLAVDDRITIDRADLGLSAAAFRITRLVPGDFTSEIEARSYSDAIYGTTSPSTFTDPGADPVSTTPPASPSGVSLTSGVRIQDDGTTIAYVDGLYTPGARTLFIRIEVGVGLTPTTWSEIAAASDGSWHHEPVTPGQTYTYRLTAVNTSGASDPVTASIVVTVDTTPPGVPSTPTLTLLFKSIRVKCWQNATKAADLAGFKVFRNTVDNSGTATEVGFQACTGNEDGVTFLDETTAYGQTYYYWVKAVDKTGNASGFSAVAGPLTTLQIVAGDVGTGAINASAIFACGVVDATAIANGAVTPLKTCLAAISNLTGDLVANSVGCVQICNCAVTAAKTCVAAISNVSGCLTSGAVNCSAVFACEVVDATAIANCAVTSLKTCLAAICRDTGALNTNSVGCVQICNCAVTAAKTCVAAISNVTGCLTSGAVNCAAIFGTGVVDAAAIANCAVTSLKTCLAAICRDTGALNSNSVGCVQICDCAVVASKTCIASICRVDGTLVANAVGCVQICTGAVSCEKIAVNAVLACHICANAVTADKICANAVTAAKICANAVTSTHICANAVVAGAICAGAITAGKFAACAIAAGDIATDSVQARHLCANAVIACHICSNAVTAAAICANAVTAAKICTGSICSCHVVADAITATQLAAGAVCTCHIVAGAVTAATIAAGAITAAKLLVATPGAALNPDPNFLDTSAWTCMDGYEAYKCFCLTTVTDGKVGNGVMRSCHGLCSMTMFISTGFIPYDPTKAYRVRLWARAGATCTACAGTLYVSLRHYNCNCSNLDSSAGQYVISCLLRTTTWTELASLQPAGAGHANTKFVRIGGIFDYQNTAAGTYHEIQDFRLEEATPATLIADGAIITAKIATNAVVAAAICAGAITAGKFAACAIAAGDIATDAIQARHVCANAVTADKICANAVTAGKICACSVCSCHVVADAITATQLAAGAVCTCHLVAGAVTTATLAAGAITAEKLAVFNPGGNLVWNGDAESGNTCGWAITYDSGTLSVSSACKDSGSCSFQVRAQVTSVGAGAGPYPVTPGETYLVRARAKSQCACGYVLLYLHQCSCNPGVPIVLTGSCSLSGGCCVFSTSWQDVCALFTISAGMYWASPNFYSMQNKHSTTLFCSWFDNFEMRKITVSAMIADGAIITSKLATDSVDANKLAANAVQACHICANAVVAAAICAGAITAGKFAACAIAAGDIATDSIQARHLCANAVIACHICANAVTAAAICSNAVTADKICANAVTAAKVCAGAIAATHIAAGQICTCHIVAGAVTAAAVAANAVIACHICSNAVTSTHICANAVTAAAICAGAITADKINAGGICANCITSGTLCANRIGAGTISVSTTICACQGVVGGFTLAASCMSAGSGTCAAGMAALATAGCVSFWAGCTTATTAPFRVTNQGALTATNATICGNVYASGGTVGGMTICVGGISGSCLWCNASNNVRQTAATFRGYGSGVRTAESYVQASACCTCNPLLRHVAIAHTTATQVDSPYGAAVNFCVSAMTCCCTGPMSGSTLSFSEATYGWATVPFQLTRTGIQCTAYICNNIGYAIVACAANNTGIFYSSCLTGVYGCAACSQGVFGHSCVYGVYGMVSSCCAVVGNTAYGVVSQRQTKVGVRRACVLEDLRRLPIYRYRYHDRNLRGLTEHIGPMSEDFQDVFGLSFGNDMIPQTDGIALAAIKELDSCVCGLVCCICSLGERLETLEALINRRCA